MSEPAAALTITPAKLSALTGSPISVLAKLSKQGHLPPLKGGAYTMSEAVAGWFKWHREQGEQSGTLPVYDSMAQCAAQAGIPVRALKQAKKSGCTAFKWNRVALAPLLKWFFSKDADAVDWGERLKKAQALREEHRLSEDKEQVADKAATMFSINKAMALMFATLDRASDTLPGMLHGMDAGGIKSKLTENTEALKAQLRIEFEKL